MLCERLASTAQPTPTMMAIIKKNAATQTRATVFSCSGFGRVIPIASMIPLLNEMSNRISIHSEFRQEANRRQTASGPQLWVKNR